MYAGECRRKTKTSRLRNAFTCLCLSSCVKPSSVGCDSDHAESPPEHGFGPAFSDALKASAAAHVTSGDPGYSARHRWEDISFGPKGDSDGDTFAIKSTRNDDAEFNHAIPAPRGSAAPACLHGCDSYDGCRICRSAPDAHSSRSTDAPEAPVCERGGEVHSAASADTGGRHTGSEPLQQLSHNVMRAASAITPRAPFPTPFRIRGHSEHAGDGQGRKTLRPTGAESRPHLAPPPPSTGSAATLRMQSRVSGAASPNIRNTADGPAASCCSTPQRLRSSRRVQGAACLVSDTAGEDDGALTDGALLPRGSLNGVPQGAGHRGSQSSALMLMSPGELLANATVRGAVPDRGGTEAGISTMGGDELSTVGSGTSTAFHMPLLGTRPSIMEEGGMGFTDLMRNAGWQRPGGHGVGGGVSIGAGFGMGAGGGGMAGDPQQLLSPMQSSTRPHQLVAATLHSNPSVEGLPGASSLGRADAGGAATQPPPSDSSFPSAFGVAGGGCWLLQQHAVLGGHPATGPMEGGEGPTAPGLLPASVAMPPNPFARVKSSSWTRLRSLGRRHPTSSFLSHVPEEEPRSPSVAAMDTQAAGSSVAASLGAHGEEQTVSPQSGTGNCTSGANAADAIDGEGAAALYCYGPAPDAGDVDRHAKEVDDLYAREEEQGKDAAAVDQALPLLSPSADPSRGAHAAEGPEVYQAEADDASNSSQSVPLEAVDIQQALQLTHAGDTVADNCAGNTDAGGYAAVVSGVLPQPLLSPTCPADSAPLATLLTREDTDKGLVQVLQQGEGEQMQDAAQQLLDLGFTAEGARCRLRLPCLQIPRGSGMGLGPLVMLPGGGGGAATGGARTDEARSGTAYHDARGKVNGHGPRGGAAYEAGEATAAAGFASQGPRVFLADGVSESGVSGPFRSSHGGAGSTSRLGEGRKALHGLDTSGEARFARGSGGYESSLSVRGTLGVPALTAPAAAFPYVGSPTASLPWPPRLLHDSGVAEFESALFVSGLASPMQQVLNTIALSRQASHVVQVTCPSEVVLLKPIGKGCAGQVFRGTWRGQLVAVKVITHCQAEAGSGAWREEEAQVKKIEREAALGICLDHPYIVATYAAFTKVTGPQAISRQGSTAGYHAQQPNTQAATDRVGQMRLSPYSSAPVQASHPRLRSQAPQLLAPPAPYAAVMAPPPSSMCFSPPHSAGFSLLPLSRQASRSRMSIVPPEDAAAPLPPPATPDSLLLRGFSVGSWGHGAGGGGGGSRGAFPGATGSMTRVPSCGYLSGMAPGSPAARGSGLFGDACPSPAGGVTTWQTHIVMELCTHGSLRAALDSKRMHDKRGGPKLHEVLPLAWEVACALQYLHANGVVHGDLKAANVMLAASAPPPQEPADAVPVVVMPGSGPYQGQAQVQRQVSGTLGAKAWPTYTAKVADFSHSYQTELVLRRLRDAGNADGGGGGSVALEDGTGDMPSPSHAAPELFQKGGMPTLQSDIYALGVVLWELYGGRKPYEMYRSPGEVLAAKRNVPTEQVLSIPDTWLAEYAGLCRSCWMAPDQRPQLDSIVDTLSRLCRTHLPHIELCAPTTITADAEPSEAADMTVEAGAEAEVVLAELCGERSGGGTAPGVASTTVLDPTSIAASAIGAATAARASASAACLPQAGAALDAEVLRDYVYGPPPTQPPPTHAGSAAPSSGAATGRVSGSGAGGSRGSVPLPSLSGNAPGLCPRRAVPAGFVVNAAATSTSSALLRTASDADVAGGAQQQQQQQQQQLAVPAYRQPQLSEDTAARPREAAGAAAFGHNLYASTNTVAHSAAAGDAPQSRRQASATTCASSFTSVPSAGTQTSTGLGNLVKGSSSTLCDEDLASAPPLALPASGLPFPWPAQRPSAVPGLPCAGTRTVSPTMPTRGRNSGDPPPQAAALHRRGSDMNTDDAQAQSPPPPPVPPAAAHVVNLCRAFAASQARGSLGSGMWDGPSPFTSAAAVELVTECSIKEPHLEAPEGPFQRAPSGEGAQGGPAWVSAGAQAGSALPAAGSAPSLGPAASAAAHGGSSGLPMAVSSSGSGGAPLRHARRILSAHHDASSTRLEPLPEMESCHLHLRPEQLALAPPPPPPPPQWLPYGVTSVPSTSVGDSTTVSNASARGGRGTADCSPFLDPGDRDVTAAQLVEILPPLGVSSAHGSTDFIGAGLMSTASSTNALASDYTTPSSYMFMDTPKASAHRGSSYDYRRPSTLSEVPPSPSPSGSAAAAGAAAGGVSFSATAEMCHQAQFPASLDVRANSGGALHRLYSVSRKFERWIEKAGPTAAEAAGAAGPRNRAAQLRHCGRSHGAMGLELGGVRDVHFYSTYTPQPSAGAAPSYAGSMPPMAPGSPAPRGSTGGSLGSRSGLGVGLQPSSPHASARTASCGHSMPRVSDADPAVPGAPATAAAARLFPCSASGASAEPFHAAYDRGAYDGGAHPFVSGQAAAGASCGPGAATPLSFQRRSQGLPSGASGRSLRQHGRQHSRMFTTGELEAVMASMIPRFGDAPMAVQQGTSGVLMSNGWTENSGFFSRLPDGGP